MAFTHLLAYWISSSPFSPPSQAPPSGAAVDSGVDGAASGAEEDAESAPEKEVKRRKLIPLPNVEGVEFEVVVQKSDADKQIMRKGKFGLMCMNFSVCFW